MIYWTEDPVADADRYFSMLEERRQRYPRCPECDEPMDHGYYEIDNGKIVCTECAEVLYDVDLVCALCGRAVSDEEGMEEGLLYFDGKYYCKDCYEEGEYEIPEIES